MVAGLNIDEGVVSRMLELFGCRKGELPLEYLGMKVGGGLNRCLQWEDVVEKLWIRLSGWKMKSLSLGGRVTLVNSVLAAIPTYRLAFAPIPVGIANRIKSIQRKFLWGEEREGPRKVAWVKWDVICANKREGGLGVRNIRWFNAALLGKWCWRLVNERERLWAKVIYARHPLDEMGKERARGGRSGRGRGWWNQILKATEGNFGDWFFTSLKRVIGDGRETEFWNHKWGESPVLRDRFPRLYRLSRDKDGTIGMMGEWRGQEWVWSLQWSREIRGRDAEAERELLEWLNRVKLTRDSRDRWSWGRDGIGIFSVRKAYEAIKAGAMGMDARVNCHSTTFNLLWKSEAPFKYKVVGWRALHDRLPTRDNLHSRLELTPVERRCPSCIAEEESVLHLLLHCPLADKI